MSPGVAFDINNADVAKLIYTAYCTVALLINSYNPKLMLGAIPESDYVDVFNVRAHQALLQRDKH